jgi:tetratricopeptide (TPR) repeat protein
VAIVPIVIVVLLGVALWQLQRYWVRWYRGVVFAAHAAYGRGDYQGQLRQVERLRAWVPSEYLFFRGIALMELGQLKEAEQSIRRSLSMRKEPRRKALREGVLGCVLREQGRFEEAIACFENAARLQPNGPNITREIAHVLLRQGAQPREALRQARKAVEIDDTRKPTVLRNVSSALQAEVREEGRAESLATLAWAEAVNSASASKVESLIAKAQQHWPANPENHVSSIALIHHHTGRAYAALGKTERSLEEFKRAAEVDPNGTYGRLAKAAIAESRGI